MASGKKITVGDLAVGGAVIVIAIAAYLIGGLGGAPPPTGTTKANQASSGPVTGEIVTLVEKQLASVKVEPVDFHVFPVEARTVGSIDFNEDMSVQVFTQYQGRIIDLFAKVGDEVEKGQALFTIDSPDLLQAESTLIAAAGTLELQSRTLARAKELHQTRAVSQRELDQATSDQQSAEGALKAARNAVRIFGKTDAEIDRIVADRKVDSSLVVASPISGRITARNAGPGLFVQPGALPAPYTVADISTMWLIANVPESDSPRLRVGQPVKARVMAYPNRLFEGKITTIGAAVDPNTHRLMVRSEINDPQHDLRPGMFATFVIQTADPIRALAVPLDGVVREGDGTMTVWVTKDQRRFERRTVRIGLQDGGYDQIIEGLQPQELIATEGALFLSNFFATESPG